MPEAIGLSAARAIARALMPSLVNLGLGSNAIIRTLGDRGLTYRRTSMLGDIREFTGLMKLESTVLRIAGDVLFPQYGMVETYLRRDRPYRVFGRLTVEDVTTGQTKDVRVSFYSDTRRSKDEWVNEFKDEYSETCVSFGNRITGFTIGSVEHQRGWDYF